MKKLALVTSLAILAASPAFAASAYANPASAPHTPDAAFTKMDKNNDGTISSAEFTEAMHKKWTEADANKDGMVTREEMRAHKNRKMGDVAESQARPDAGHDGAFDSWFTKMDADKNGSLNQAEFDIATREKWGQLDADGNGSVTKTEFASAHHRMKSEKLDHKSDQPQLDN